MDSSERLYSIAQQTTDALYRHYEKYCTDFNVTVVPLVFLEKSKDIFLSQLKDSLSNAKLELLKPEGQDDDLAK